MKPTWYWDDLRWYYDDISWDYIDVIGIDWVIFANRNNINTFGLVWVDPCASRLLPGYDESIRCMDEFILRNSPAWKKVMLGLLAWCDFCQDFIANWWIVIWIDTWHHLTIIWHHLTPTPPSFNMINMQPMIPLLSSPWQSLPHLLLPNSSRVTFTGPDPSC